MTENLKIFIIILVVNLLIVIGYIVWNLLRRKEERGAVIAKTLVMCICPLAGPLFLMVGYIGYRLFFSQAMDLEDVVFSKERAKVYLRADEERERNMVSMEEALAVTDKMNLRKLMMNVVRGDVKKSLGSISLALNSEDSETSHYAASVLQDELNTFRTKAQQQYRAIVECEEFNSSNALELIHFMNEMLTQNVFTEMEQESMVQMMLDVCELLYQHAALMMSSYDYEAICLRLLDVHRYDECQNWCERLVECYPNSLPAYTCRMKLSYYTGQQETFFSLMEELRRSNIIIDKETLELIRIFS